MFVSDRKYAGKTIVQTIMAAIMTVCILVMAKLFGVFFIINSPSSNIMRWSYNKILYFGTFVPENGQKSFMKNSSGGVYDANNMRYILVFFGSIGVKVLLNAIPNPIYCTLG